MIYLTIILILAITAFLCMFQIDKTIKVLKKQLLDEEELAIQREKQLRELKQTHATLQHAHHNLKIAYESLEKNHLDLSDKYYAKFNT